MGVAFFTSVATAIAVRYGLKHRQKKKLEQQNKKRKKKKYGGGRNEKE